MDDNIVDELEIEIRRLRRVARAFDDDLERRLKKIDQTSNQAARAWSGSFIGYHATTYYRNLQSPPPDDYFDSEWGRGRSENWVQVDHDALIETLYSAAGVEDREELSRAAEATEGVVKEARSEILATLDAVLAVNNNDARLKELRDEVAELKPRLYGSKIAQSMAPCVSVVVALSGSTNWGGDESDAIFREVQGADDSPDAGA